jgi:hypothetical protein
MQAPNAQGIMGLMSQGNAPKPPQGAPQQPQPSPMKASPMAAVGSVEDRVAAYRGNPAPLQQRYAMSQDLLDLLALQKIKSEKESAARQMQMQMSQQAAAQGDNMTVAQQREKEVMDLTKNELAQQRGDTAQQQVSEQQDALQKLMGGIASAPGAQAVAQPKMMASGGIVAFDAGGDVDSARARARSAREKLQSFGTLQRRNNPEGYTAAEQELQAAQTALQMAEDAYAKEMSTAGVARPAFNRTDVGAVKQAMPSATPAPVAAQPAVAGAPIPPVAEAAPPAPAPAPPAPAPRPAPAPTPRPAAAPAAAGLPAALPEPTLREVNMIPGVERSIQQDVTRDSEAADRAKQEEIRRAYALSPEQRAVYEQGIAQRKQMFDQTYDPERQRQESLTRFLTGAGGRRYGEFGAGARESLGYEDAQRQNRLKDFNAMQTSREGLVTLERAGIAPSIEGGIKALEAASAQRRTGQTAGANIFGTESQTNLGQYDAQMKARDAALNREVERLRIQATNAATAVQREGLEFGRMQGHLNTIVTNRARAVEAVNKRFAPQLNMLEMQLQATPNDKKLQEAKAALQLQITAAEDAVTKDFDDAKSSVEARMFGTSGGGGYAPRVVNKREPTK